MSSPTATRGAESLEEVAIVALEFGRLLMESGASARHVEKIAEQVSVGLGAEHIELRVGYASLTITLRTGYAEITRMRKLGPLGVNQKLHHNLQELAARIEHGSQTVSKARSELERLVDDSPHHADWIVALGVGVACAAFGRLLDVDWRAVLPIFAAAVLAQLVRKQLARWKVNVFLATAAVSFLSSLLAGFGARLAGSQTVARDMVVAVLLLVPGIPAFNAQFDILDGRPTLGSARAVWVAMILIFMTLGLWIAEGMVREGR